MNQTEYDNSLSDEPRICPTCGKVDYHPSDGEPCQCEIRPDDAHPHAQGDREDD